MLPGISGPALFTQEALQLAADISLALPGVNSEALLHKFSKELDLPQVAGVVCPQTCYPCNAVDWRKLNILQAIIATLGCRAASEVTQDVSRVWNPLSTGDKSSGWTF